MSNALEDRLLLALIDRYKDKGINLQKILDNQLFQQLPLNQKLEYIEKYKNQLSDNVHPRIKPIIQSMALGALTGISGLGLRAATGGTSFSNQHYMAAAGVGAVLGSLLTGAAVMKDREKDLSTRDDILNNKYLSALVNRSSSPVVNVPKADLAPHIKLLQGKAEGFISLIPS